MEGSNEEGACTLDWQIGWQKPCHSVGTHCVQDVAVTVSASCEVRR